MEVYSKNINDKSFMERLLERYPCVVYFTSMDVGEYFIFVRYNYIWKGRITKFDITCNMIWYEVNGETGITIYGNEIKVFRMKDIQRKYLNALLCKLPRIMPELKLEITDYLV